MSKIALTPNASGTGTLTIAAPNTNTDRTLTLPDEAGTVLINGTNQNVGIGTASPNKSGSNLALTVNAASGQYPAIELSTGDTGRWYINADATNVYDTAMNNTNRTFYTGGSERVRIDTSGNVGVGTASPAAPLHVFTTSGEQARFVRDLTTDAGLSIQSDNSGPLLDTVGVHNLRFFTGASERARIDQSGNLYVNTTTFLPNNLQSAKLHVLNAGHAASFKTTSVSGFAAAAFSRNGNDGGVCEFFRQDNNLVGSISVNSTSTSYNTSSDYRLKENVVPLAGAADRLAQIPVHRFNFIADPDKTVDGFLAHEVQEFVPECVTGEKDAVDKDGNPVYQGIDQSKLVPLLTAALQEALADIATLKTEIAALKGASA